MYPSDFIPGFESIIGQQRPKRILSAFLRKREIPHALLFSGIEGAGKLTTARVFAMACNCNLQMPGTLLPEEDHTANRAAVKPPCGRCQSCKKVQSGHHPDVILVQPSGSMIKIAQIRSLLHTIAMKPYEAKHRIVIISDAQAMNPEAGNALLKVLEEPPDRTVLILISPEVTDLLPTIVSRCQHIRFDPISRENLKRFLVEQHGVESEKAEVLSMMASGSFSQALNLSKTDWTNRRNRLITMLGLGKPEPLSSRPLGSLLLFAERLSENKEELAESLRIMKSWIRDLVIAKYSPDKIINSDIAEEIQRVSPKVELEQLLSNISAIEAVEGEIRANRNIRLLTETLVMDLSGRSHSS